MIIDNETRFLSELLVKQARREKEVGLQKGCKKLLIITNTNSFLFH